MKQIKISQVRSQPRQTKKNTIYVTFGKIEDNLEFIFHYLYFYVLRANSNIYVTLNLYLKNCIYESKIISNVESN